MGLVDKDGNPITGTLSVEEAETHIVSATEKLKTEYETKLAEATKKLEENTNPALRRKAEAVEKDKEEALKQIGELKNTFAKQTREAALNSLVGNDQKLKEKVLAAYAKLAPVDETDLNAVSDAFKDAYRLASDIPMNNVLHVRTGGVGGAAIPQGKSDADSVFSQEVKEMGKKGFGLTDADFAKYADKVPPSYR